MIWFQLALAVITAVSLAVAATVVLRLLRL
jgi:hypothetical protein